MAASKRASEIVRQLTVVQGRDSVDAIQVCEDVIARVPDRAGPYREAVDVLRGGSNAA